jgi:hypothetical protein
LKFYLYQFFIAFLGFIKTSTLPIPLQNESLHPHSLPQIQSGTSLLPTFHIDPPPEDNYGQLDYAYNHNLRINRYSSYPLPSRNDYWKN